ncbi:GntR family transcriptional regulator [Sulfolobus sp. E5-1-F]|uniref:GntR family transcriptional regulator n=1 Tax=Sulfolobaceae TaxID=118883 RepID=UPI001297DD87|nr:MULTISPECIES: GntR family transcriptional regulator [unclassified Sulfolobus]QGA54037.1 GntR family transcriptional regulator [Sulfolobus sp. E5-1-F]QGA69097.1 GntR family transcriptional regulator [Sulfolobus sp. E11-6]
MTDITIRIDLNSKKQVYEQIADQIIELIAKGVLNAGDPLPSVREMAAMLGVNMLTVDKAYKYLEGEGFVTVYKKRFVVKTDIRNEKWKEMMREAVYWALASGAKRDEILLFISSLLR